MIVNLFNLPVGDLLTGSVPFRNVPIAQINEKILTLPLWNQVFVVLFIIFYIREILQKPMYQIMTCNKQHKTTRIRQLQSNFVLGLIIVTFQKWK